MASHLRTRTMERWLDLSLAAPASSSGQAMGETIGLNKRPTHFLKARLLSTECPSATQIRGCWLGNKGSFFKLRMAANNGPASQALRLTIYMECRLPMPIPAPRWVTKIRTARFLERRTAVIAGCAKPAD